MRNPTVCRSIFDSSATELRRCPHNILFVEVLNGEKFYTVRHDDVESDDFDAAVETGSFELAGETYNARFSDIYGRINYTNITL